ncbi:dihydroorotase [Agrococcus baldri]|uniref:Dihydroorotase n=1 Tax=Agrococcus baldri TaxID=153730 RepID=A0AA94HPU0_9MICO|nr:dihydroorotase [Agrococcus baldri]SFS18631.1 dihydroorotase [Agrococcus baldri]
MTTPQTGTPQTGTARAGTTLVTGAAVLGGEPRDLAIADGAFVDPTTIDRDAAEVVDASGLVALPGLVDLHTHLRQPGGEQAETVATGVRAAAAGGYTCVFAMANTTPVADTPAVVEQVHRLGLEAGLATVRPIGAVSVGLAGERLADMGMLAGSAARVRVFSDDGHCVADAELMRRALEHAASLGAVIAQHAQDPSLTRGSVMHESPLAAELGLTGWPSAAEAAIVARDAMLAEAAGARLHVCHVSTLETVEVVRAAKAKGIAITAEVTPHHLLLTEELVRSYDARYKVNPPLRADRDVRALREALADGTIDIVATDHAPHAPEAKQAAFADAAFGMVGLETALGVVQEAMVETGLLDWAGVARVMSTAPAAIGRESGYDAPLEIGSPAHLVLVDPAARRTVEAASLKGRSTNSPFLGVELPGTVLHVWHGGRRTVMDAEIAETQVQA